MKPLKPLFITLVLAILSMPFYAKASSGLACTNKSAVAVGAGLFKSHKTGFYSNFFKQADKKKRLAKSHRKALLKKAQKGKML